MARGKRPSLDIAVLGLEPSGARTQAGRPTWSWPEGLASRGALPELLAGRFEPGGAAVHEIEDCQRDDPDRRALAALDLDEETGALERALGDWRLAGGDRSAFAQLVAKWREQGYERLLAFDPVHLKAETDHAITFGPRFLDLDAGDFDALLADLDHWLAADGMHVERMGNQVYLVAERREDGAGPAAAVLSRSGAPLACLLNRNAGVFIDETRSDPVLRQWLTELQMWLYPQPMNDRRAARGQPILSSFWPHGMNELADGLPESRDLDALVVSDSPAVLARVPASLAWTPASVEPVLEALRAGRAVRVVLTEPAWCRLEGDLGGFQAELARIDAWLAEVMTAVPERKVALSDGEGGRWRRRSPWRRIRARLAAGERS
jgi:hypothetical protein